MVALLVEGRGMWRIEGLGRWVTSVSELPGALTRTNSHAARRGPGALIQRAFSRRSPLFADTGVSDDAVTPSRVSPGLALSHRASSHLASSHLASPRLTSPRLASPPPHLASTPADAPMNGLKLPRALSTPGPYTLRLHMTFHSVTVKGDVAITRVPPSCPRLPPVPITNTT